MKDVRRETAKVQYSTSFVENNNNIQFSALPKSLPELKYFTQEDMNALEVFLSGENIDASKFVNPSNGKDSSSYISAVIEAICRNQLATLKQWSHTLDSLPRIKQEAIWKTCCLLPAFANYNRSSFTVTISAWDSNPLRNMSSIAVLYSAIVFLHQEQLLPEIQYNKHPNLSSLTTPPTISNVNTSTANSSHNNLPHFQQRATYSPAPFVPQKTAPPSLLSNHTPLNYSQQVQQQLNRQQQALYRGNTDPYSNKQQRPPPGAKVDANKQQLTVCSGCNQWLRFPIGAEIIRCPKCNNIIMNHLNQVRDKSVTFSSVGSSVSPRVPPTFSPPPQTSRSPPIAPFNLPTTKPSHPSPIFPSVSQVQPSKPLVFLPPPTSKIPLLPPQMQMRSSEPMGIGMTKHQLDLPLDKKSEGEDWRLLGNSQTTLNNSFPLPTPPKQPMQKVVINLERDENPVTVKVEPRTAWTNDVVMKEAESSQSPPPLTSSNSMEQDR